MLTMDMLLWDIRDRIIYQRLQNKVLPAHQAALVVFLLWPRIGKKDVKAVNRVFADHFFQDVKRVVFDNIKVL